MQDLAIMAICIDELLTVIRRYYLVRFLVLRLLPLHPVRFHGNQTESVPTKHAELSAQSKTGIDIRSRWALGQ
jgi:hypothetical protein